MKPELINVLICPQCHVSLDLQVHEEREGQIYAGRLRCQHKGCEYPISRYVPRFVDADAYADSFSKQRLYVRRHFRHYLDDRSGDQLFFPTTGFAEQHIGSGPILEVGCGYGRFVDVVQRQGGAIIGIDLSTHSIDLAQDFVGLRDNVHLIQCDLFQLPFRQAYFTHIYSIGVLHHTPDTRKAFAALVPYLRSHGQMSIWVYPPSMKTSTDRWRPLTMRLPHSMLYAFCIVNQGLFSWIRGLPGGWRFSRLIPGVGPGPGRKFWLRVMSDFDDLSPTYASTHTPEEVHAWFVEEGLQEVRMLPRHTSVTGYKK